jgi:hypothetical protein
VILVPIIQDRNVLTTPPGAYNYYYDHYSCNDESKFNLKKKSWKRIKQNNSSGKYLTDKELEYLGLINGILKTSPRGVEYFTLDFLCNELEVSPRHLFRIRSNTSHIFITKWKKALPTYKGRLTKVYVTRPTKHTAFLLGETNYYKALRLVNHSVKSIKVGHGCPSSLYIDDNNKNIRSNAHARVSNFSNFNSDNSNLVNNKPNNETELVAKEVGASSVTTQEHIASVQQVFGTVSSEVPEGTTTIVTTPIAKVETKTKRPTNLRKTRTREEQKQRKVSSTVPNYFLGKAKRINEIQPHLTDEVCEELRSRSKRPFTNRAIRQITKAISVSEKGKNIYFLYINGILSYLTKALINEKRDAVKTSGENYYTLAGKTQEDAILQQEEKYLSEVEEEAINRVSPTNQFRAKLANALERHTAYSFLSAMEFTEVEKNTLKIALKHEIDLTEHERNVVLSQGQAVFNSGVLSDHSQIVEKLEFVVSEQTTTQPLTFANNNTPQNAFSSYNAQTRQLPQGLWGEVCQKLIGIYGEHVYNNWLSKLTAVENTQGRTIELKAPNSFVKQWVECNYEENIYKITKKLDILVKIHDSDIHYCSV